MDSKDEKSTRSDNQKIGLFERLRTQSAKPGAFSINSPVLSLLYSKELYKLPLFRSILPLTTQLMVLQCTQPTLQFGEPLSYIVVDTEFVSNEFNSEWVIVNEKDICFKRIEADNKNAGNKDLHSKQ